ncbi:putative nuclease HARBI1 [Cucumis melo var. makuwa]|uniref:Nuclease HARBI1 n=1 Tax=Cucumis melo var. makuwa TaxID=1194695 RepID=A0A5A7T0I1_CUCMM|nr:putative nuclease HARBI1 [Cucumis melo var. makuwa]TYJ96671.1 putative nuclease HARBI1 [Cucumis melo var. makuwa]
MDQRCFDILCHLLRIITRLTSMKVVDVEKMVAMFLHILAYNVKNRVIQQDFMQSGETIFRHFNMGKGSEKRETFVAVRSSPPSLPSSLPSVAAVRRCDYNFSFSLPPCTIKPIGGGFPNAVHGVGKADEAFPTSWIVSGKTASEEAFPMRDQHNVRKAYPDSLPPMFVPMPRTASRYPFPTYFSLPPTFFSIGKIPISCSG